MSNLFEGDSLFWFYSVVAQVFAALLALVGVFVVYRLQIQKNIVESSEDDMRAVWSRFQGVESTFKTASEVMSYLKQHKGTLEAQIKDFEIEVKKSKKDEPGVAMHISNIEDKISNLKGSLQLINLSVSRYEKQRGVKKDIISNLRFPMGLMSVLLITSIILTPCHKWIAFNSVVSIAFFFGVILCSIVAILTVLNMILKLVQE